MILSVQVQYGPFLEDQLLRLPFSQETKAEKEEASGEEQDLQYTSLVC